MHDPHRPDLDDLLEQMRQVEKLGPLNDVLAMIPGAFVFWGPPPETAHGFRKSKAILEAMSPPQREDPGRIDESRLLEIADRSGATLAEVKELLRQYWLMRGGDTR